MPVACSLFHFRNSEMAVAGGPGVCLHSTFSCIVMLPEILPGDFHCEVYHLKHIILWVYQPRAKKWVLWKPQPPSRHPICYSCLIALPLLCHQPCCSGASQVAQWYKESTCQCKSSGFDPCVERAPGEGNGNPHQYSCLGNPMDRGAWWACKRVKHNLVIKQQQQQHEWLCSLFFRKNGIEQHVEFGSKHKVPQVGDLLRNFCGTHFWNTATVGLAAETVGIVFWMAFQGGLQRSKRPPQDQTLSEKLLISKWPKMDGPTRSDLSAGNEAQSTLLLFSY